MTVKELKEFLEQFDDDVKIVTFATNFELKGSKVDARAKAMKCKKVTRRFTDGFDGTVYEKDVYRTDDNGETVIVIYGF